MVTDSRSGRRATCSSGSGSRESLAVGLDVSLLVRFRFRVAVVGGGGGLRTVLLAVRVVERLSEICSDARVGVLDFARR